MTSSTDDGSELSAPAEMKEALAREGTHPAAGSTLGHDLGGSDPSSVDEVTGDETRLRRHDTPGAPGR